MLRIKERVTTDTFVISVNGLIDQKDLQTITPELERAIDANDQINLVYEVHHPEGIAPGTMFEEIKQSLQHFLDINRIAVLHSFTFSDDLPFAHSFTPTTVRNFPRTAYKEACRWAADDQSLFFEHDVEHLVS